MTKMIIAVCLLLCVLVNDNWAVDYSDAEICRAIFKAEGGYKADYLYGIRSIKYKDEAEAKQICLNTIRNQRKRHLCGNCPESLKGIKHDYLTCLWHRYCPPKAHKLNVNWLKNVTYYLERGV